MALLLSSVCGGDHRRVEWYNFRTSPTHELQNSKLQTRYRVYREETGLLPLRQGAKETVDSPYKSEPSFQNFYTRIYKLF